ncbi:MAG: GatB/YqeY domain-containing protein [Candidatus Doudnabacteria bacterium]|nr:GatB/YqeY domain-containing protein [Candidatus Doudnabacteria bacterium]
MLLQKIDEDLKSGLKEKNEVVVSSLRNLKAALKNAEIEKQHALSDEETISVIAKKVKQHRDSIDSFKTGGREDLVSAETAQMTVLQKYLPAMMSEEEVSVVVKQVITESSATTKDFGKVMKDVMAKVKGQADGTLISKLVKENLK